MPRFIFSPVENATNDVEFGALTLSGAGGVATPPGAVSITNAGGTNLTVSDGFVVPASAGVSSGTVTFDNDATWTITALPNTYSARQASEIDALVFLDATLSGRTVKLRPGTYGALGNYTNRQSLYTSPVTFEAHDPSNKPVLGRWGFAGSNGQSRGNTTFRNIRFQVDARSLTGAQSILTLGLSGTDRCANITVDQCDFVGNLGIWSTENGAPPAEWAAIEAIRCDNLTVTDCTATGIVNFIGFLCGSNHEISRNVVTGTWGDFLRIGPRPDGFDSANIVIADNVLYNWAGNYDAYRHCDFIQGFDRGGSTAGGNVTDVQVLRNRMFFGTTQLPASNGAKNAMQFMLMQALAGASDHYIRWTVRGNVAEMNSLHGITWERRLHDGVIEGNTFIASRRAVDNGVALTRPAIRGWMTDCIVRQNVAATVNDTTHGTSSGNTISNNYTTTIDYTSDTDLAALFQGPTFKPDTPTELISQFRMKANGPLDADNSGSPTVGDIGALGTTTANGIANFDNRTINTALIG